MGTVTDSIVRYRFIHNRDRRFGSGLGYIPALIQNEVGELIPALFTKAQFDEAIERAKANPEDAPRPTWFKSLFNKVRG